MRNFCLLLFVGLVGFASQSRAATSDSITVTVSLGQVVSVSLDSNFWGIGSVVLGGVSTSPLYTATNNGNVAIDLTIKGTDGDGGWVLAPIAGAEEFSVDLTNPVLNVSTVDQVLATNVAVDGVKIIEMTYGVPVSDTFGGGVDQGFILFVTASLYVP